jgi:prophage antirepressor-like protein
MNHIVPFQFDSRQIRTITDEHGAPWFVLRDVLEAMQSATTTTAAINAIKEGLGDGYANDIPIPDSLGRPQATAIVAEAGATYLLSRSNTEQGRNLNRFIHTAVLPSIRATGQYQVRALTTLTPSQMGRQLIEDMLAIAALTAVPQSYALQVAGSEAARQTDMPWDRLLTGSAHMSNLPADDVMLEPSELGALFDLTPADMNKRLEGLGLQRKEGGEWVPTDDGAPHCVRHAWTTKNKSGYNLKWRAVAIEHLIGGLA